MQGFYCVFLQQILWGAIFFSFVIKGLSTLKMIDIAMEEFTRFMLPRFHVNCFHVGCFPLYIYYDELIS